MFASGPVGPSAPFISVVIPTHNRARLVGGAVASVYAQEGLGQQFTVEVIAVDDGSTDDTRGVLAAWPSVRYVRLDPSRGAAGARNAGLRVAQGEYVAFLDDDDMWLPHRLRVQLPILQSQPATGVVYGQGVAVDEAGQISLWPEDGPSGEVFAAFVTRTDDFINPNTLLVRRTAFAQAGEFDERLPTMEHYDMAVRLAFHVPWYFLPGPVAYGRFSLQGKWYRNILSGQNEGVLPGIIERALDRLPDTPKATALRCAARAAVCATVASQRWDRPGVGLAAVQAHLLATLRAHPELLTAPPVLAELRRVAQMLAQHAKSPGEPVRRWADEVQAALAPASLGWLRRQRLRADFLDAAARGLQNDSPRRALVMAAAAWLRHPALAECRLVASLLMLLAGSS